MTSPSLKRPLDFELTPPQSSGTSSSYGPVANGGKRRCFTPQSNRLNNNMGTGPGGGNFFIDSSSILPSPSEDIASMIKDELHRTTDSNCNNDDETPVLTIRQTQTMCEKLIKDREQKLKEEYDKILANKLAEQYDLLAKANYSDTYNDTQRMPSSIAQATGNTSISALAAAFSSIQRSAATVPSPVPPNTANPLPGHLSNFATISANGHHTNTLSPNQIASYLQRQAAAAATLQAQQHRGSLNSNNFPLGPVLLASSLDEQLATPEALFTLFGVFGDVIRVKILFNKKDNALIQMADANQAQVAQGFLDKQKVYGKIIRVTRSKHQLVQMPRDGNQSDAGLTKDFTNSPLHRFKFPGSRNYLNIYPPSNTLHISNIPANIDENDIRKAFKEACCFEYSSFKFFPKERKMGLIKFNSIEHATIALIKMHNFQISEDNNLRVSFSKSVMQQ